MNDEEAEIIGGLKVGERVILLDKVGDGVRVKVRK
jgi:hypothetical protein